MGPGRGTNDQSRTQQSCGIESSHRQFPRAHMLLQHPESRMRVKAQSCYCVGGRPCSSAELLLLKNLINTQIAGMIGLNSCPPYQLTLERLDQPRRAVLTLDQFGSISWGESGERQAEHRRFPLPGPGLRLASIPAFRGLEPFVPCADAAPSTGALQRVFSRVWL